MAKNKRIPLIGDSARGQGQVQSNSLSIQRTVNLFPVKNAVDDDYVAALYGTAGLSNAYNSGTAANIESKLYGPLLYSTTLANYIAFKHAANSLTDVMYLLAGDSASFDSPATVVFPPTKSLYPTTTDGSSPLGVSDIVETDNLLVVVSGESNTTRTNYLSAVSIQNPLSYIALGGPIYYEDAIRPTSVAYLDGYGIINHVPPTMANVADPYRGRFYANFIGPLSIGNVAFKSTDFASFHYNAGEYVLRVETNGRYLYLFGETHYEVWYNSGNEIFPFEPIKEATKKIGLGLVNSQLGGYRKVAKYQDLLFFVGIDDKGTADVYQINGLEITPISNADSFGWKDATQVFVTSQYNRPLLYVCFGTNAARVYDIKAKVWHEETHRGDTGFFAVDSVSETSQDYAFYLTNSGDTIRLNDTIYHEDWKDASYVIPRYRVTQHITGNDNYAFHHRVRVRMDTAPATLSLETAPNANIWLYSTDNGGRTWQDHGKKSFNNSNVGNITGEKRTEWFRLGRSEDRVYKIWTNATAPIHITDAYADVELGYR